MEQDLLEIRQQPKDTGLKQLALVQLLQDELRNVKGEWRGVVITDEIR